MCNSFLYLTKGMELVLVLIATKSCGGEKFMLSSKD